MLIGKTLFGKPLFGKTKFGKSLPLLAGLLAAFAASLAAPSAGFAQSVEPPKADAPIADAAKPGAATPQADVAPVLQEPSAKTEEIAARQVIQTPSAANWDDAYEKIGEAVTKLRAAAQKAKLNINGRPQVAFTDTDDNGFKFIAMLPVEAPLDAKLDLGADVTLAQSPSGKAIKFQHRGAYDDIDSTYEAITAYLDEKGLEARNLFVEDYLNDAKDATDMGLQVDIYVFLK